MNRSVTPGARPSSDDLNEGDTVGPIERGSVDHESDLHLAVHGPYVPVTGDDWERLVWRAGAHRREIEDAHAMLDLYGAPREQGGGVLTLRGRLEAWNRKAEQVERLRGLLLEAGIDHAIRMSQETSRG